MSELVCPHCGGSGWKIVERDGASGAERCDCRSIDRASLLEERAGIPPLYAAASFDNFKLPEDNPPARRDLAAVVIKVNGFVKEFPRLRGPGLLLIGSPGSGKTHLAVAALRMLMARGFEGAFIDYQVLLEKIRTSYDSGSGASDRAVYETALEADVLLIDDLGSRRVSDWVEDTMTSIITDRCNNKKPLIATTNVADPDAGDKIMTRNELNPTITYVARTLGQLIGERARSRLYEMCQVVRMPKVDDYRVSKLHKLP